jgi:hypothetical protein
LDRGPLGRYVLPDFGDRIRRRIRIAITPAAYAAIAGTLALGTVAIEPERAADGHALASCRARAKATSPNAISSTTSKISRRNPAQGSGGRARIGPSIRV